MYAPGLVVRRLVQAHWRVTGERYEGGSSRVFRQSYARRRIPAPVVAWAKDAGLEWRRYRSARARGEAVAVVRCRRCGHRAAWQLYVDRFNGTTSCVQCHPAPVPELAQQAARYLFALRIGCAGTAQLLDWRKLGRRVAEHAARARSLSVVLTLAAVAPILSERPPRLCRQPTRLYGPVGDALKPAYVPALIAGLVSLDAYRGRLARAGGMPPPALLQATGGSGEAGT